jgi:hypothetical protein
MMQEIFRRLNRPDQAAAATPDQKMNPLLATWLEPLMLRQIVDRLNPWIRSQASPPDWTLDPLLAGLPEPLRQLPMVQDLDKMEFSRYDGFALREADWLRDVSAWARGDDLDELSRAKALFDWTVRNIQLESDPTGPAAADAAPQVPWETLLLGRGTAMERAWLFMLLARQQGLDAVVLALADPADAADKPPRPWALAVLSEGNLYLFDPALGLPIPAADGVKLDSSGRLVIQPATLAEAAADDTLLRQLDLDPKHPYPVKAADLKHVVALIEASPAYLAKRIKLVEKHLVGSQKMVLTASASAQAERLKALPQIADARLWTFPYETLERRLQLGPEGIRRRLVALMPFYADPAAPLYKAPSIICNRPARRTKTWSS